MTDIRDLFYDGFVNDNEKHFLYKETRWTNPRGDHTRCTSENFSVFGLILLTVVIPHN